MDFFKKSINGGTRRGANRSRQSDCQCAGGVDEPRLHVGRDDSAGEDQRAGITVHRRLEISVVPHAVSHVDHSRRVEGLVGDECAPGVVPAAGDHRVGAGVRLGGVPYAARVLQHQLAGCRCRSCRWWMSPPNTSEQRAIQ